MNQRPQHTPVGRLSPEAEELIRRRQSALAQARRARLRHDREPADPITSKLFADLHLAAWAKHHSSGRAEACSFERDVFAFLIRWLGALERPDLRSFDYCSTVEPRVIKQTGKLRSMRR